MTEATQDEALLLADEADRMHAIGRPFSIADLPRVSAELRRQHALLNSPELLSFRDGVVQEAAHQRERWGTQHDGGKTPEDWFWLVGYLSGRSLGHHKEAERLADLLATIYSGDNAARSAIESQISHHREKAVHHCITTAAACANWHAAVVGKISMRPGVDPASIIAAAGEVS